MKKYFLAFTALALAVLLNAFTPEKKQSNAVLGDELIWYYINGSDQINPAAPINPGDPVDEVDLESEYSACLGTGVPCARGFMPGNLPVAATDPGEKDTQKASAE